MHMCACAHMELQDDLRKNLNIQSTEKNIYKPDYRLPILSGLGALRWVVGRDAETCNLHFAAGHDSS